MLANCAPIGVAIKAKGIEGALGWIGARKAKSASTFGKILAIANESRGTILVGRLQQSWSVAEGCENNEGKGLKTWKVNDHYVEELPCLTSYGLQADEQD